MREARFVERVWSGADPLARAARLALSPFEYLYATVVAARGALYDRGVLAIRATAVPAVSVGNLTVGGTGKTPVAAWVAATLAARGGRPAVVLRGYGGDEPLVHAILNPDVRVVIAADRVAGVVEARALGADVAVLDDAFQHRRARRIADIVLVSADRWSDGRLRLLPAGPWREPLRALRRASIVLVTRKAASAETAAAVLGELRRVAPRVPGAVAHLAPDALARASGDPAERAPLDALSNAPVLAISAIGDPAAFHRQLTQLRARVTAATYPDHHAFTGAEARELAGRAAAVGRAVCTLKDAVKLGPLWPRAAPTLWYVSQRVDPETGGDELERLLDGVLAARDHRP